MRTRLIFSFGIALTLSSLGCHSRGDTATVPVDKTAQPEPVASTPSADTDATSMSVTRVEVDRRLADMCGMPLTEIFFMSNSAQLQPAAKDHLQRIASCLTEGPARDQELILVGRASPPGSDQANQTLGESRAESVAAYLRQLGVNRSRVEIESRGEQDASNRTEVWPLERRVTVKLQD